MNELKKLEHESEEQYLWKVGQLIDSKKVESWASVNDIVNKQLGIDEEKWRDESSFRKRYQAAKKFYENCFSKMESKEYSDKLEKQCRELEKQRQKLYATKTEYTRQVRQQSRFELFYENIANELEKIEVPEFIGFDYSHGDNQYILTIADIHAGANFITETNEYSFEEINKRFNKLYNDVVAFIDKNKLSYLKVLCLGDDIQGILRLSDLQINESSVVKATVFVSKAIASFLNSLSQYCYIDYYHCPTSNHSQIRPLGTKASEIASEDVEYIICNYIKDVLVDNDRIHVHTNFGYEYIEIPIFNFNTIAMHGHTIKNIDTSLKDLTYHRKKFYTTMFLAHYHAAKTGVVGEMSDTDCEVIVCPSFVGSCPYSDKLLKGAKPSCYILGYDEKYGHTETYKIFLNN
jgi:hypothetical protein